jgi:hypothetical protein
MMASTETLSRTPPLPPKNPFRRFSSYDKEKALPSPPAQPQVFHIETELVPKPLFSRRTTLVSKAAHATVELPPPGSLSPMIYPSDTSIISSNRSSIVSVSSSRPSTSATSAPSEASSRTGSFTSFSSAHAWVPPQHLLKPLFGRSKTLPTKATYPATERPSLPRPASSFSPPESSLKVPALRLAPARTSCFSPAPVWTPPKRAPNPEPKRSLRRKETPRKETLRTLRAKDSNSFLQDSPTRNNSVYVDALEHPMHEDPIMNEKPVALSNLRSYSMDAKGVFILNE